MIKFAEHLLQILGGIVLVRILKDHPEELSEIDIATLVFVVGCHGFVDVVAPGVVTLVLFHRLYQVSGSQPTVTISIKLVENVLPQLDIAFGCIVGYVLARLKVLTFAGA